MQADPYSLDRLHDIVQAEPVAWWPPPPVWLCVMSLALVWALWTLLILVVRWHRNAYRREAIRELELIASRRTVSERESRTAVLIELSRLLKRVAVVAFSRERVAELSGDRWLAFLDETCDGVDFSRGPASVIGTVTYDPAAVSDGPADVGQIIASARKWIVGHKAEGSS